MDELTLSSGGRERRAVVHAPLARGARPVVVVLHGSGGTGEWALRETRWPDLADAEGVLIVAPDATRPDPEMPLRFYTNPAVWNDGSGKSPADRVVGVDDVGFLRDLLDAVARGWTIDPARIYVTGFSNGAGMTFRVGHDLAPQLAAIAPVAGHLPPLDTRLIRPVPTFYLIGTNDPLLPLEGGVIDTPWARRNHKPPVRSTLARWAVALGLPPDPVEIHEEGGVRYERWPGDLMQAWLIDGLGHHWPGGRGELNPRIAGPALNTVDATRVVWEFFRDRRL